MRLLHQRWEQLQIDVRFALHAGEPQRIQRYVLGGGRLAHLGVFDEIGVQLHMTQTVLRTARDPELPCFWRSACLEGRRPPAAAAARPAGAAGAGGHARYRAGCPVLPVRPSPAHQGARPWRMRLPRHALDTEQYWKQLMLQGTILFEQDDVVGALVNFQQA